MAHRKRKGGYTGRRGALGRGGGPAPCPHLRTTCGRWLFLQVVMYPHRWFEVFPSAYTVICGFSRTVDVIGRCMISRTDSRPHGFVLLQVVRQT